MIMWKRISMMLQSYFLDKDNRVKCKYSTYWVDEDVYWFKNFKNQID